VWRPEQRAAVEERPENERRMLKNWEPRLIGMAYSERNVFLVEAGTVLSAEHLGKLLFLVDLWRRDPDYAEHRGKRVRLVILVREACKTMIEFARRRRVHVVVLGADTKADALADSTAPNHSPAINR
jgi:hypothetical protein